jgi:hypothetical protein
MFGYLALMVGMAGSVCKDDKWMKAMAGLASLLIAGQYYLIGVGAGMAMLLLNVLRFWSSIWVLPRFVPPLFLLGYTGLGVYAYETPPDVLGVVGCLIGSVAVFYFARVRMRLLLMLAGLCWLLYNYLNQAWGPMVLEIVAFTLTGWTAWRLSRQKNDILPVVPD